MKEKYTLITGATSGIGLALAKEFAEKGHALIFASRNQSKMRSLQKEFVKKYGVDVDICKVDLSRADGPEKVWKFCKEKKYQVNILVNNSGAGLVAAPQVDQSFKESDSIFELNCGAVLKLSMLFGKEMKKRGGGYILNVASTAAFQPMPYGALYGASKAFVLSFSEAMYAEMKEYGVGVTAVCPGITDTAFFKHGKPKIPGFIYKLISAELVAKRAIKAMYKRKPSTVPYFQHWLIAQLRRILSRRCILRLMKRIEKVRKRAKV